MNEEEDTKIVIIIRKMNKQPINLNYIEFYDYFRLESIWRKKVEKKWKEEIKNDDNETNESNFNIKRYRDKILMDEGDKEFFFHDINLLSKIYFFWPVKDV